MPACTSNVTSASAQLMAAPLTSTLWHAVFAFLIPATGSIVQMHFPNSSPLVEHPASIWMFITCILFYCFALVCNIKCHIYNPTDITSLNRSDKAAIISGSLAYAALISALVHHSIQPLVLIICLMLLFIYFNYKKIAERCQDITSYLCDLWKSIESRASNFSDRWMRTENVNVSATKRPPV